MDAPASERPCAAPILAKFLETTYGEHAGEAASRRVDVSDGRQTSEVKRVWVAVRGLLQKRKHA